MSRNIQELEDWIKAHPVLTWAWTVGIVVLILYAMILWDWMNKP